MRLADRVHKIGISVDPRARAEQVAGCYGVPIAVVRTWLREHGDAVEIETLAHKVLAAHHSTQHRGREIFNVTAEVACCAVELAIALHRDAVTTVERDLPISVNMRLAEMADLPCRDDYIGYLPPLAGNEKIEQVLKMRRRGVKPGNIYTDLSAVRRALRAGEVLFVETDEGIDRDKLRERGVDVCVI